MVKRGQITAFVIIGLLILVVIGIVLFIGQRAVSQSKTTVAETVSYEALDVKNYIETCLDQSVEGAVDYCSGTFATGGPKCPDYEPDIAEKVEEDFCDCIEGCTDFSTFKSLDIEVKSQPDVQVIMTNDKKTLNVLMVYPLVIKKGDSEFILGTVDSPFSTKYELEETACVHIEVDENCKAKEAKQVEILGLRLSYNVGDKVAIGGSCIAC